jgi:acetate kinase
MSFILTINGGSSSIKFAVFKSSLPLERIFTGEIERIGLPGTRLTAAREGGAGDDRNVKAGTFEEAAGEIVAYLRERLENSPIAGIGHRVVHGGIHLLDNQIVDEKVLDELRRAQPLDLTHLPREISLIEAFEKAYAGVPQVACFDTAFGRDLPRVARMLPIPRHYFEEGVRRFGFHGLSYTYLIQRLGELAGKEAAQGRVILAHLGSGASMTAVRGGKPIDTTMAFTPTAGLVMGTRPGDIDPGLLIYLTRVEKKSPDEMDQFISHECGMMGVSETSSDLRDLQKRRQTDPRAADALDLFYYQAKKYIGALHAALGRLDTLVFAGGIGEHSAEARAAICNGLECIGIQLDPQRNQANEQIISGQGSKVAVRIIPTDEEIVIAQAVYGFLSKRPN